ncbi:hypothetical protein [Streptomyces griseorubiginosus]|uniref:hypothetical protein n=1 Tax=Streptomyces griseorubiginosus TaxID=67304 RepID=UPI0036EF830A
MTGTALLVAALAGCSTDKDTMASWAKNGGEKHVAAVAADLKTLIEASDQSVADPAIASRCTHVLNDVKAAKAFRDPPDKSINNSWQETLDRVQTASSHCLHNVKAGEGSSLVEAIDAQSSFRDFLGRFELVLTPT